MYSLKPSFYLLCHSLQRYNSVKTNCQSVHTASLVFLGILLLAWGGGLVYTGVGLGSKVPPMEHGLWLGQMCAQASGVVLYDYAPFWVDMGVSSFITKLDLILIIFITSNL